MAKKEKPVKVLVLLGSPRKHGNSALLAEAIAKGAEAETVFIQDRKIKANKSLTKAAEDLGRKLVAD